MNEFFQHLGEKENNWKRILVGMNYHCLSWSLYKRMWTQSSNDNSFTT